MANPILTSDKFPYLFTILVGLIGFQMNYIIKTLTDSPLIEYNMTMTELRHSDSSYVNKLTCEITNLSSGKLFPKIDFIIRYPTLISDNYYLDSPHMNFIHPVNDESGTSLANGTSFSFNINKFQPHFKFIFSGNISSKKKITCPPFLYVESADTLSLITPCFESWLVKNSLFINIVFTSILLILAVCYFFYILKS